MEVSSLEDFFLFFWSNPTTAHRLGDPSQRLVGSGAGAKLAGQTTTSRTLTTGQGGLIYYHNTHRGASPGIDVFTYSTTRQLLSNEYANNLTVNSIWLFCDNDLCWMSITVDTLPWI